MNVIETVQPSKWFGIKGIIIIVQCASSLYTCLWYVLVGGVFSSALLPSFVSAFHANAVLRQEAKTQQH